MAAIYILRDPRDQAIRYVGQTKQPLARRLSVHLCLARKGSQTYSSRWIRTLLDAGLVPLMILLEETTEPDTREIYWIAHFLRKGARLTNVTEGGGGPFLGPRGPLSAEHKDKLRAAALGKPKSEAAKANMRKPKPPGMGAKVSAAKRGEKHGPPSAETRAKLSAALKGRPKDPPSAETRAKISATLQGHCGVRGLLTADQVRQIRALKATGKWSQRAICAHLGIAEGTVSKIINQRLYTWVE